MRACVSKSNRNVGSRFQLTAFSTPNPNNGGGASLDIETAAKRSHIEPHLGSREWCFDFQKFIAFLNCAHNYVLCVIFV